MTLRSGRSTTEKSQPGLQGGARPKGGNKTKAKYQAARDAKVNAACRSNLTPILFRRDGQANSRLGQ